MWRLKHENKQTTTWGRHTMWRLKRKNKQTKKQNKQ
ncbi:MAG: hypothetical protein BWY08_00242 [Bacteroidetes bacterium ADurb.Bin174]|nr:MAG: hypothetical protein BWY08_00242 [Bacteroidetes bacterium ADurb.Bin174]